MSTSKQLSNLLRKAPPATAAVTEVPTQAEPWPALVEAVAPVSQPGPPPPAAPAPEPEVPLQVKLPASIVTAVRGPPCEAADEAKDGGLEKIRLGLPLCVLMVPRPVPGPTACAGSSGRRKDRLGRGGSAAILWCLRRRWVGVWIVENAAARAAREAVERTG